MDVYYEESSDKKVPAGHICTCGETHRWSPYIYAHYRQLIVFTCPMCGKEIEIKNGEISEL